MKKILNKIALILFLSMIITVLYAFFIEPNMLTVKHVEIEEGPKMKVVLFSDTHFGEFYSTDNVTKIVEKINEQEADLVIFVGDLFDNYKRDIEKIDLDLVTKQLSEIKGEKIAVRGNHDIGGGFEFLFNDFMENCGFDVMINESRFLEEFGVNLVGFDDLMLGKKNLDIYVQNNEYYNLFIMHEPDGAKMLSGNANGLVVGGHSHGGQVNIPFLSQYFMPPGAQDYIIGMYDKEDTKLTNDVFVTTGIGTTFIPVRLFCPPEIVVVNFGGN